MRSGKLLWVAVAVIVVLFFVMLVILVASGRWPTPAQRPLRRSRRNQWRHQQALNVAAERGCRWSNLMLMSMPAMKHQDAKDRLGRPGVSFWLDSSGKVATRLTLFLDREQGLLGEEQTLLSALDDIDAAPPVVIGYVTYVDARLVDTTAEVTK